MTTTARDKLTARIEAHTTDELFAILADLDVLKGRLAADHPEAANLRMVAAAVSDVITAREGIDAHLDAIFMDDEFTGTYREAMLAAIAKRDADNRTRANTKTLRHSQTITVAAPVDEAYWQQAEADDLEARAAGPLVAVWTPEDFAQTVRDANAARSNVIEL
jgi:hypothetical protein